MQLFRGPPSLRISATQDAGDYRKGSVGVVGKSRDDPHVTEKEELLRGKGSACLGRTKSGDGFSGVCQEDECSGKSHSFIHSGLTYSLVTQRLKCKKWCSKAMNSVAGRISMTFFRGHPDHMYTCHMLTSSHPAEPTCRTSSHRGTHTCAQDRYTRNLPMVAKRGNSINSGLMK